MPPKLPNDGISCTATINFYAPLERGPGTPNTIYYGLLAGSLVSSILVPALVRHIDEGDRASCERVVGGCLGVLLAG